MSSWKPIYEIQINGSVTLGDVSHLLKIAQAACDIKIQTFDRIPDASSGVSTKCDQVSWYQNNTNSDESIVTCWYFQNMATNASAFPLGTFQSDMYHYYSAYNSDGVTAESRWLDGSHIPVGNQTFRAMHSKWFAEPECIPFDQSDPTYIPGDNFVSES